MPTKLNRGPRQLAHITTAEIESFVGIILQSLIYKYPSAKEFITTFPHNHLTATRYKKIIKYLKFKELEFFERVNKIFGENISLGGHGTFDETIWPWKGDHPAIVHIERKPNATGFKVFNVCFPLTLSNRPYCVFFIPDLSRPSISVTNSLDTLISSLPLSSTRSITMDNWFCMLGWLYSHPQYNLTFSVKEAQDSNLFSIFSYELPEHHYRTFQKGHVILTVFADVSLVRTASTCFNASLPPPTTIQSISPSPLEITQLPPRLSVEAIQVLEQLSVDDLRALASTIGEAKGIF